MPPVRLVQFYLDRFSPCVSVPDPCHYCIITPFLNDAIFVMIVVMLMVLEY